MAVSPRTRLILSILALIGVFVIGAIGFYVIDGDRMIEGGGPITPFDAAYMTAITLSTVGFNEVWPLSHQGRLWTLAVITFGIATVSVAFTSLISLVVSGDLRLLRERKRMEQKLQRLHDHAIVCGYGRMGSLIAEELLRRGMGVAVLEQNADYEDRIRELDTPYLFADATEEDSLLKAGLMHARALITTLPHDADNVYITLTAHTLRPELTIVARAEQSTTESKLKRAGASRVICPHVIGATKAVNVLLRPNVVDFVEIANKGVDLEMDEFVVGEQSPLLGTRIRDSAMRDHVGAIVVAIKREAGETLYNPEPDAELRLHDTLILIGPAGMSEQLKSI